MKQLKLFSMTMVVILLLTAITPVSAGKPEINQWTETETIEIECGDAYAYDVIYRWTGTITWIAHWDQGFGTVHHDFLDTFSRSDGKGQTYTHEEQNSMWVTDDNQIVHGINWHMVIPGHGSVLIMAGYYVFDWDDNLLTWHGNPDKNNTLRDICDAFADE